MTRYLLLLAAIITAMAVARAEGPTKRAAATKTESDDKATPDIDLSGIWRGWVVYGKGEQTNRGTVHLELKVKGNHIISKRLDGQGDSLGEGTFTLTRGQFYLLDATEARGRGKPRTYQGICRFGPDLMKWCVATPGNKRPVDFETKGQQFLLILKRQRP